MKIAFFGTGLLGNPMAHRLLKAKYNVVVYNRTTAKTESLRLQGAEVASNPGEAAAKANVFITLLTDWHAIDSVLFSGYPQTLRHKILIQMSTISPVESLLLKQRVEDAGGEYMEAPVLGSIPQAKTSSLIVLFGGLTEQYKKWRPFLEVFGNKVIRIGNVGQAAAAKLALNHLIASLTTAFSLSLGYCRETGVNVRRFMEILKDSPLYAPTFDKKLERMLNRDFTNPNFPLKHLLKDLDLILTEFGKKGLDIDPLEGIKSVLLKAVDNGDGDLDYSALYNILHPIS
jgi:3-hydroxyisobutyrate dehydrogenase